MYFYDDRLKERYIHVWLDVDIIISTSLLLNGRYTRKRIRRGPWNLRVVSYIQCE